MTCEDLLGQVVADEAVAVADLADELVRVGPPGHGQRSEVQPRRPPLRALHQVTHRVVGQAHLLDGQQGGGFRGREGQVCGADLGQPAGRPKPADPQPRVGAGEDHQVSPRRQVLDEKLHLRVTGEVLQQVEVVEQDDELLLHVGHGLEQPRQHTRDDLAVLTFHEGGDVVPRSAADPLERQGHVGPETHRVVVARVE